jgi:hypothetical protein
MENTNSRNWKCALAMLKELIGSNEKPPATAYVYFALLEIDDLSPSTRQLWSDINFESGKLPDDQNESIIVEGMVELAMRVAAECGRVGSGK